VLRELSYARVRESRLQDERLALDPRRAIFGLAALPLLHLLFDFVGGWVDRRSVNVHAHTAKQIERKITQNLRASTRAGFNQSKLARVDARKFSLIKTCARRRAHVLN